MEPPQKQGVWWNRELTEIPDPMKWKISYSNKISVKWKSSLKINVKPTISLKKISFFPRNYTKKNWKNISNLTHLLKSTKFAWRDKKSKTHEKKWKMALKIYKTKELFFPPNVVAENPLHSCARNNWFSIFEQLCLYWEKIENWTIYICNSNGYGFVIVFNDEFPSIFFKQINFFLKWKYLYHVLPSLNECLKHFMSTFLLSR